MYNPSVYITVIRARDIFAFGDIVGFGTETFVVPCKLSHASALSSLQISLDWLDRVSSALAPQLAWRIIQQLGLPGLIFYVFFLRGDTSAGLALNMVSPEPASPCP